MNWVGFGILTAIAGLSAFVIIRTWHPGTPRPRTVIAVTLLAMLSLAGIVGLVDQDAGLPVAAAVITSVAVATLGGGPVAEAMFRWASFKKDDAAQREGAAKKDDAAPVQASGLDGEVYEVLRGGLWIGMMERGAIAATLWAGWPEGLAVVLAVKGLGRFTELKQHAAAEQFILGTFASVLWGGAAYGVGLLLI